MGLCHIILFNLCCVAVVEINFYFKNIREEKRGEERIGKRREEKRREEKRREEKRLGLLRFREGIC